jgi:hypothetical protein
MLEKVSFKLIICIFSSIINAKRDNTRPNFILNPYMKNFKSFKILLFIFHQVHPTHYGVIINKSHDIFVSICTRNNHRSAQIRMNQFKFSTCCGSRIMKGLFVVFSKDTSITLLQFPRNSKQTRNTIFSQQMKIVMINMAKSSMPGKY